MKVLYIGHKPHDIKVIETFGTLKDFQTMVGGNIETAAPVELREQGLQMLVNEEGVITGQPLNENLYPFFYVGPAVIVATYGEEFTSLRDHHLVFLARWLRGLKE